MKKEEIILKTELASVPLLRRGKVRDIYEVDDCLLIIATDRLSAFDVILPNGIPYKGKVLTQISKYWFSEMKDIIENHIITFDCEKFPEILKPSRDILRDRSMLVKKAKPLPVECVVRGYLSGSGWQDYKNFKAVAGIKLPENLRESEKLSFSLFSPSTKAETGHDENIDFKGVEQILGKNLAQRLMDISIKIYERALTVAEKKGIIIADTKFEFGLIDGELVLIDELLTPDSSRFWPMDEFEPGRVQRSFDKQFVRDYLIRINWGRTPPAPELPQEIIQKTSEKYLEALHRLAGIDLTN
jgi:phosphoribosylaminoimidazole-succinocarboxamide synthase